MCNRQDTERAGGEHLMPAILTTPWGERVRHFYFSSPTIHGYQSEAAVSFGNIERGTTS